MATQREFPAPDDILLPRDHAPILWVSPQTWHCPLCDPDDTGLVATSTVVWLGQHTDGPHGRCSSCGQKYALSRLGEAVPSVLEQQQRQAPE